MRALVFIVTVLISTSTLASDSFQIAERLRQSGKFSEALPHYTAAAKEQSPEGTFWLATFYYEGLGTKKDVTRARPLFIQAAEKGVVGAYVVLANIYALGQGVPVDLIEAHKWISLSWQGDISKSPGWQQSLESRMTPEQIAEAKRRAHDWFTQHP